MTQREINNLAFLKLDMSGVVKPHATLTETSGDVSRSRSRSFYLSNILDMNATISSIDSILSDVNSAINYPGMIDDSLSLDDGTYVAIYLTNLVFGNESSYTDPNNHTMPLSDFKELLLEWKSFVASF